MQGDFQKILKVTKNEQKVISTLIDIMDEIFKLDSPQDLFEVMSTISVGGYTAWLDDDKGTIKIKYQDD